ncbi:Uncharacterised protein [Chromobacterium violaceum]|uniref:Uncharacterized protein n=1 Tax=Chromobacterium violaceum TaxID=536 RepID=A0A447TLP4_CHRVL|nr:Uncharacterised protein [Chromobacterium violaceum]
MVSGLCATITRVSLSRASTSPIARSLPMSRWLVASSSSRMLGRLYNARASSRRWRCPPDRPAPCSPTRVW